MKKTVIVKKCKNHRVGIVVFHVIMLILLTICIIAMQYSAAIVFYIPYLVMAVPMAMYFLTWQIRFEEDGIIKSVFFRKSKKYSFTMLREVVKSNYASERYFTIRMYFLDGKMFQFRLDDENAIQAKKFLQKHCSIKTL